MKIVRPLLGTLIVGLAACDAPPPAAYQGYAEGEYVFVGAPLAGQLQRLAVARGAQVEAGALLFRLEGSVEEAVVSGAKARAQSAASRVTNLAGARRAPEIEALRATVERSNAAERLARIQLDQNERLFKAGFISDGKMAEVRAHALEASAQVREAEAQLRTALQSLGRAGEIEAAKSDVESARADVAQAKVRLEQKTGLAPASALVQDTFYRQGEWVPAGSPIVSLLPPANVKVRFFVPQAIVGTLREGRDVKLACDGCGTPIPARITYIAPQAEYTPPVIYSRESRAKLVFMIEARPALTDAPRLRPGQPIDVTLDPP